MGGESVEGSYDAINEEIVRRFGVLFGAGEIQEDNDIAESVVDASEIINTLAGGGVTTVGYAAEEVPVQTKRGGILARIPGGKRGEQFQDSANNTNRITSLIRKATLGRLTLPCEIKGAERALVVVSGPPNYLNRKGIEKGRRWIEEVTGSMEVRGGDYPILNENKVGAAVMLSGVVNIPRIKNLQRVAIEAQENMADIRSQSEEKLRELIEEGTDELEPLF